MDDIDRPKRDWQLPEDATAFERRIDQGLDDIAAGRIVDREQVRERIRGILDGQNRKRKARR